MRSRKQKRNNTLDTCLEELRHGVARERVPLSGAGRRLGLLELGRRLDRVSRAGWFKEALGAGWDGSRDGFRVSWFRVKGFRV
jgi:hypothetical protein